MSERTTFTEKRFFEWYEDDVSVTLRAKSGSYGGGQRSVSYSDYNDVVGSLCADDYKGINGQYVDQGKVVVGWRMLYR